MIRIGTRGSQLALWQAKRVAHLIQQRLGLETELVIVHTRGDLDHSRALHTLPDAGFFTKELQRALLDQRVDVVVHSLKDLPIDEPEGLTLAAVLDREAVHDLLLAHPEAAGDGPLGLRPGARLGTSSLRRAAQALAHQPDLAVVPLRGNVPTRVARVRQKDVDATLLAAAGVTRLGIDVADLTVRPLPLEVMLPAPGQGALAVEVRRGSAEEDVASRLDDAATREATSAERSVLRGLGGGCHLPLGALARRTAAGLVLDAVLGQLDDALTRATVRRASACAPGGEEAAGQVLAHLREAP